MGVVSPLVQIAAEEKRIGVKIGNEQGGMQRLGARGGRDRDSGHDAVQVVISLAGQDKENEVLSAQGRDEQNEAD
jgi:hypothetical protein